MKITKWVDFGCEVDVEVDAEDIRNAISEALACVTEHSPLVEGPSERDVCRAFNVIAAFLNAITDEQYLSLRAAQRKVIGDYMGKAGLRFAALSQSASADGAPSRGVE